jgi:hypothetical protein
MNASGLAAYTVRLIQTAKSDDLLSQHFTWVAQTSAPSINTEAVTPFA